MYETKNETAQIDPPAGRAACRLGMRCESPPRAAARYCALVTAAVGTFGYHGGHGNGRRVGRNGKGTPAADLLWSGVRWDVCVCRRLGVFPGATGRGTVNAS